MDPTVLRQLLLGVVPPVVGGAVLVLVLWWVGRRRGSVGRGGAGRGAAGFHATSSGLRGTFIVALCAAVGVVAMHALLFGQPRIPPTSAFDWLPISALVLLVAGVLTELVRPGPVRRVVTMVVIAALLVGAGWLSARNLIANSWTAGRVLAELGGFVCLGTGFALAVTRLGSRPGPIALACVTVALGVASQASILFFFSLKLGQFVGIFAAFAGGAFAASLVLRSVALPRSLLLAAGAATAVAVFQALHFGDAARPHLTALGVALVPWVLLAGLTGFRHWRESRAARRG